MERSAAARFAFYIQFAAQEFCQGAADSKSESGSFAWRRYLDSSYSTVFRATYHKAFGLSARCLKDWSNGVSRLNFKRETPRSYNEKEIYRRFIPSIL